MLPVTIRHAKLNELFRVIFITQLANKIPYQKNTLVTIPHEPEDIKSRFSKKEFFIIVAVSKNKIVGAARYKINNKNQLYFYKLAVLKTYRNKGVGSFLVNEIEKIAKRKHYSKIMLVCVQGKKLSKYYKKFGYKIDKIKKHHDHHDVYMSKTLAPCCTWSQVANRG